MKVYFGFTYADILTSAADYNKIRETILDGDHEITRDWLESAIHNAENNIKEKSRADMFKGIVSSIRAADVCIFDVTVRAMSIGQQISYALSIGKPTLVILNLEKGISFKEQFIGGNKSGYLELQEYTSPQEIERYVKRFLRNNANDPKVRLNLSIERSLVELLEKYCYENNINKTSVVRESLKSFLSQIDK